MLVRTDWLALSKMHFARVEQLERRPAGGVLRQEIVTLCGQKARVAVHEVKQIKDSAYGKYPHAGHDAHMYCQRCLSLIKPADGVEVVHDTSTPGPATLANLLKIERQGKRRRSA